MKNPPNIINTIIKDIDPLITRWRCNSELNLFEQVSIGPIIIKTKKDDKKIITESNMGTEMVGIITIAIIEKQYDKMQHTSFVGACIPPYEVLTA